MGLLQWRRHPPVFPRYRVDHFQRVLIGTDVTQAVSVKVRQCWQCLFRSRLVVAFALIADHVYVPVPVIEMPYAGLIFGPTPGNICNSRIKESSNGLNFMRDTSIKTN